MAKECQSHSAITTRGAGDRRRWEPIPIAETTTSLYKRPSLLRRLMAAMAGSAIAIVIGAVAAVVIAFGTGLLVMTLTDLLKK